MIFFFKYFCRLTSIYHRRIQWNVCFHGCCCNICVFNSGRAIWHFKGLFSIFSSLFIYVLLLQIGKFDHVFIIKIFSLCTRLGQLGCYFKLYFSAWLLLYTGVDQFLIRALFLLSYF